MMSNSIHKEMLIPQPREAVWQAITDSATLAEWMFPNDFQPCVGHKFHFHVPPNPTVGFEGLVVRCEVLECQPPSDSAVGDTSGGRLVFSWSAGGPVENTQVSFVLEPHAEGTRLLFTHSGFDITQPWGQQAFAGAEYGWSKMLKQLTEVVASSHAKSRSLRTERILEASPREIFAAFENPELLARWWGPDGFTNTFEKFEFQPGGQWIFKMHAPNGASYPNESFFREIQPDNKIVIEHVVNPWFLLTITLTTRQDEALGQQTHLSWVQEFESPECAAKMRQLSGAANEQVLNRLESVLASKND